MECHEGTLMEVRNVWYRFLLPRSDMRHRGITPVPPSVPTTGHPQVILDSLASPSG